MPRTTAPSIPAYRAIIAFGSNMGDRKKQIDEGLNMLEESGVHMDRCSPFYETAPIGAADQTFVNGAALVSTNLPPPDLLETLLAVEKRCKRVRTIHWGNRTLDLDIILMQDASGSPIIHQSAGLTIPHPRSLERDFVLVPAADVAPDWVHPQTMNTLVDEVVARKYHLKRFE